MTAFFVDERKCVRDGVCVSECAPRLIELRADSPAPAWVAKAEEMCVHCGHCVAACPQGAISLSTMPVEECPPVQRELFFRPAQVEQHLRARRSVRNYEAKPVPREVLSRLIDTARFAPSASNGQRVQWLVAYDAQDVHKLAGLCVDWIRSLLQQPNEFSLRVPRAVEFWDAGEDIMIAGNAPHLIFAVGSKADNWTRVDCTIALTYLELAAPAFGLGTCWGGLLNLVADEWPPMRQMLGLKEDQVCTGAMMIGYPKHEYQRIPLRKAAQVTWL